MFLQEVSWNKFKSELESQRIGIQTKAKNFLVVQGTVESIAMMGPKDRAVLFEEISGSAALKEQYDELKKKMLDAQSKLHLAVQRRNIISEERKAAMKEKQQVESYQVLLDAVQARKTKLYLFQLLRCENAIRLADIDVEKAELRLATAESCKSQLEKDVMTEKAAQVNVTKEIAM